MHGHTSRPFALKQTSIIKCVLTLKLGFRWITRYMTPSLKLVDAHVFPLPCRQQTIAYTIETYWNRKGWFSNTSFTTGLKTLPTFRPDALVFFRAKIFALKNTRASGRNVGKVFNPVVKLVLENQPFLMPEPAEKPSLQTYCNQLII